ncbi:MAG: hypothetical protein LZF62_240249 [Nitrospira sp.]|nr:MAG: hypothetical protein LZF62_240249 [Nitrospira sp.]
MSFPPPNYAEGNGWAVRQGLPPNPREMFSSPDVFQSIDIRKSVLSE